MFFLFQGGIFRFHVKLWGCMFTIFFSPNLGEMIQFGFLFCQMGWFNHQLITVSLKLILVLKITLALIFFSNSWRGGDTGPKVKNLPLRQKQPAFVFYKCLFSSFFQVTFWFPKWRSLKPWKGHLKHPKRSLGRTWLNVFETDNWGRSNFKNPLREESLQWFCLRPPLGFGSHNSNTGIYKVGYPSQSL